MWRRELRPLYAPSTLLCLVILVLWLRSHWHYDAAGVHLGNHYAGFTCLNGQLRLDWQTGPSARPTGWERRAVRRDLGLWNRKLAAGGRMGFDFGTDRQVARTVAVSWRVPPGAPAPPPLPPPPVLLQGRWVVLPLWLPALLALVVPTLWAIARDWRARRCHAPVRRGVCPGCGYDLRAGHDRCPECGRPVDLAALLMATLQPK